MSPEGEQAFAAAIKFLAHSDRFESEVRKKLKDFDPLAVDEALERLKARNFVDDSRAAASFVRSKGGRRSLGFFRIEAELRRRGVAQETIDGFRQEGGEEEKASLALESKYHGRPDSKPKAYRFLISRGFASDVALRALTNLQFRASEEE